MSRSRSWPWSLLALVLACSPSSSPQGGAEATTPAKTPAAKAESAPPEEPAEGNEVPPAAAATATPEIVAEVAAGFNAFGLQLYRTVATTPGDHVLSPASVAMALAMTHAGAKGPEPAW